MLMSKTLDDLVLQRLYAREASLVNHANALDQKANYLLVAITFLATQLTNLLGKPKLGNWHWVLFVSGIVLGLSTVLVVLSTRLQTFWDEGASGLEAWASDAERNGYGETEILAQIRCGARDRLSVNTTIFEARSKWLEYSFYCVVFALMLNLASLITATF